MGGEIQAVVRARAPRQDGHAARAIAGALPRRVSGEVRAERIAARRRCHAVSKAGGRDSNREAYAGYPDDEGHLAVGKSTRVQVEMNAP